MFRKKKKEVKKLVAEEQVGKNPIEELAEETRIEEAKKPVEVEQLKPKLKLKTEEETDDEDVWEIREVATQFQRVVYNKETKKAISVDEAIVELLNRTQE